MVSSLQNVSLTSRLNASKPSTTPLEPTHSSKKCLETETIKFSGGANAATYVTEGLVQVP